MTIKLYHHKTDGGAEYLCTQPVNGTNEGDLHTALIRLDGEPELLSSIHAAAPDLLDALKKLEKQARSMDNLHNAGISIKAADWSNLNELCNSARAAIKKAEGE